MPLHQQTPHQQTPLSRRGFLAGVVASGMTQVVAFTACTRTPSRPPNIVFVFADDLGWADVPFQGSDFMETPRLEALRQQGMTFTNAYASMANCAPSRACMLSSMYSPRHAVYAVQSTKRGPVSEMRLQPVPNVVDLDSNIVTFGEAMREAGYRTGLFGKWHLGFDEGHKPTDQGFDDYLDSRYPNPNRFQDEPDDPKGLFSISRAACEFMEENRDRPFLAYIAHHAIHTALEARPSSLRKFEEKTPGKQHSDPLYAACTYDLDAAVGVVLDKLEELGLTENTVVLFTSDNGGTQKSSQEPLRGSKGGYYEGGIREPMLVRWPGVVQPGSVCDVPVSNIDFYPTFLEIAGVAPSGTQAMDGESLGPLLSASGDLQREALFWHFPGYLNDPVVRPRDPIFRTRPVTVVRKGDWKLHLYHEEWQLDGGRARIETNNAVELYNLRDDVGEHNNLALSSPEKREELVDEILNFWKRTGAVLPTEPTRSIVPLRRRASVRFLRVAMHSRGVSLTCGTLDHLASSAEFCCALCCSPGNLQQ
jgi:arylsulfatase A-like enzyme